jgi:acyl-CoA hydrolase
LNTAKSFNQNFVSGVLSEEEKIWDNIIILTSGATVTTSRVDVDYIVTEFGVASLRGRSIKERVKELINIAHPNFRDFLRSEAQRNQIW